MTFGIGNPDERGTLHQPSSENRFEEKKPSGEQWLSA